MKRSETNITVVIALDRLEADCLAHEHMQLHPKWKYHSAARSAQNDNRTIIWKSLDNDAHVLTGLRAVAQFTDRASRHLHQQYEGSTFHNNQEMIERANHMNSKYYHI